MASLRIEPLGPDNASSFFRLHDDRNGAGWCRCAAWWVPSWDGWGERTAAENLAVRCSLHEQGRHDGLLAFGEADDPVGWAQVGRRDRLPKLVEQLELAADPDVWAVTCFLVAPTHRRRGVAARLLGAAIEVAKSAGASRLEGYPRVGHVLADDDAWTGTERLFASAGFDRVDGDGPRAVFALSLR